MYRLMAITQYITIIKGKQECVTDLMHDRELTLLFNQVEHVTFFDLKIYRGPLVNKF